MRVDHRWKGSLLGVAAALFIGGSSSRAMQQPAGDMDFIASLRSVNNGLTTISSLNLPLPFLQHISDGEIRGSFRAAARKVVADSAPVQPPAAADGAQPLAGVDVRSVQLSPIASELWTQYSFIVPNIVGFRAPLGAMAENPGPFDLTQKGEDAAAYREAAVFVAENLAREGLLKTTMRLIARSKLEFVRGDELNLNRLRAVGVPVDLLACFTVDGQPAQSAIIAWIKNGSASESIDAVVTRARLDFKPSAGPGFHVLSEDGSDAVGTLRLQLPTHRYRMGAGDGSVLDVYRQLMLNLPDTPMWVSMHERATPALRAALSAWKVPNPGRFVLVPNPANITQWAQDNGKTGTLPVARTGARETITIAPRFASRSESRTTFVPSDSMVMETLSKAGMNVVQSPLHFQGGNLLPITDPRNGMRLLLIGEAEIYRNIALGLSADQVQQAFGVEFGVSRVVIIPAVSLHIDLDFTIRQVNGELVACITDELAASRIIYAEGLKSLVNAGAVPSELAAQFELATSNPQRLMVANRIMMAIRPLRVDDGSYSQKFTSIFAKSSLESPAANAQRFMAAADTLVASFMDETELNDPTMSPPLKAYMQSLKRRQMAHEVQIKKLADLGMRIVKVPGLSDYEVGVNSINGIHLPGKYVMPVFGGWFEPLDRAAMEQLQKAFGPSVNIVPIASGMAQASDGGLHCMVGLYPTMSAAHAKP